jgi:hypothetical protein
MKPYSAVLSAPAFAIGIHCNDDEITAIEYLEPQPEVAPKTPLAQEAVRQLRAWLKDPGFDFGLPLAPGRHAFPAPRLGADFSNPAGPHPDLWRGRHGDQERSARGGQCLRRQSLSHRRPLPSRGRGQPGDRRLRPPARRLPARREALASES